MQKFIFIFLFLMVAVVSACKDSAKLQAVKPENRDTPKNTSVSTFPPNNSSNVFGGKSTLTHKATGYLVFWDQEHNHDPYFTCSGVLITKQWFLTNAHCVLKNWPEKEAEYGHNINEQISSSLWFRYIQSHAKNQKQTPIPTHVLLPNLGNAPLYLPLSLQSFTNSSFQYWNQEYQINSHDVFIHPGYFQPQQKNGDIRNSIDLALVRLAEDAPIGNEDLPILSDTSPKKEQKIYQAGSVLNGKQGQQNFFWIITAREIGESDIKVFQTYEKVNLLLDNHFSSQLENHSVILPGEAGGGVYRLTVEDFPSRILYGLHRFGPEDIRIYYHSDEETPFLCSSEIECLSLSNPDIRADDEISIIRVDSEAIYNGQSIKDWIQTKVQNQSSDMLSLKIRVSLGNVINQSFQTERYLNDIYVHVYSIDSNSESSLLPLALYKSVTVAQQDGWIVINELREGAYHLEFSLGNFQNNWKSQNDTSIDNNTPSTLIHTWYYNYCDSTDSRNGTASSHGIFNTDIVVNGDTTLSPCIEIGFSLPDENTAQTSECSHPALHDGVGPSCYTLGKERCNEMGNKEVCTDFCDQNGLAVKHFILAEECKSCMSSLGEVSCSPKDTCSQPVLSSESTSSCFTINRERCFEGKKQVCREYCDENGTVVKRYSPGISCDNCKASSGVVTCGENSMCNAAPKPYTAITKCYTEGWEKCSNGKKYICTKYCENGLEALYYNDGEICDGCTVSNGKAACGGSCGYQALPANATTACSEIAKQRCYQEKIQTCSKYCSSNGSIVTRYSPGEPCTNCQVTQNSVSCNTCDYSLKPVNAVTTCYTLGYERCSSTTKQVCTQYCDSTGKEVKYYSPGTPCDNCSSTSGKVTCSSAPVCSYPSLPYYAGLQCYVNGYEKCDNGKKVTCKQYCDNGKVVMRWSPGVSCTSCAAKDGTVTCGSSCTYQTKPSLAGTVCYENGRERCYNENKQICTSYCENGMKTRRYSPGTYCANCVENHGEVSCDAETTCAYPLVPYSATDTCYTIGFERCMSGKKQTCNQYCTSSGTVVKRYGPGQYCENCSAVSGKVTCTNPPCNFSEKPSSAYLSCTESGQQRCRNGKKEICTDYCYNGLPVKRWSPGTDCVNCIESNGIATCYAGSACSGTCFGGYAKGEQACSDSSTLVTCGGWGYSWCTWGNAETCINGCFNGVCEK